MPPRKLVPREGGKANKAAYGQCSPKKISVKKAAQALDVIIDNHVCDKDLQRADAIREAVLNDRRLLDDVEAVIARRTQKEVSQEDLPLQRGIDRVGAVPFYISKPILCKYYDVGEEVWDSLQRRFEETKKFGSTFAEAKVSKDSRQSSLSQSFKRGLLS